MQKDIWQSVDADKAYRRYYEIMFELCESGLYTGLAHPDSIKCFGYTQSCDMTETYSKLTILLNKHGMYVENNGGLRLNYSSELELGLSKQLLNILMENKTTV